MFDRRVLAGCAGAVLALLVTRCLNHTALAADDDTAAPSTDNAPAPAEDSNPYTGKFVRVPNPMHAYEYATLRVIDLPDHEVEAELTTKQATLDEIGHNGPESGRRKLLRDIGGHGFAPITLPLLNELGNQGWELVFQDRDDRNSTYTFKRQTK